MTNSPSVGPVFGRAASPVRKPGRDPLKRVSKVVRSAGATPLELVHGSERVVVPAELAELLETVIDGFEAGDTLTLVIGVTGPEADLTSQDVADLLNVSRPHVVKLAREGVLPHRMVGNRHRFSPSDVLAYQRVTRARCEQALKELILVGGYVEGDF